MLDKAAYYVVLYLEAFLGIFGLRLYEEPPYTVLERLAGGVEIRSYAPRVAAEVELVETEGKTDSNTAFRLLFAYIAGANGTSGGEGARIAMTMPVEIKRDSERIAMTVPVVQAETGGAMRMQFFLPAGLTRETAPVPSDTRVRIVDVPEETMAVLRFTGSRENEPVQAKHKELGAVLAGSRWTASGPPFAMFYDAPFTIPFLRRNEVAVAVRAAD